MGTPVASTNPGNMDIAYLDLGGGRNTRKDPHAIKRNQLAVSINGWIPAANSFGKRPGNSALLAATATGSAAPGSGLVVVRFNDVSNVIVQSAGHLYAAQVTDAAFTSIATGVNSSAKLLNAAQIYDPAQTATCAFIVNGHDAPRIWEGPGNSCVSLTSASAPLNHSGSAVITPAYVMSFFNSIWYSGEPTEPTAVYISDPTAPESFTYGGNLPGAAYLGYFIGFNDGVAGGNITGIMPISASSVMIYKESAIYRMDHIGYYGDIGPWDVNLVSATVGCVSPKSLVNFDTFHVFLGQDGVYTCDGQNISQRPISDNNPDLFEGYTAAILDRTTAVGVRYGGSRYLLFYDNGGL